jgi:DNA replication and repair protein RecF
LSAEFSPKVNIFLGDNGQGKSNLLEALFVLTTGDSFRYADNENLIKSGESEAFLKAQIVHDDFDFDLQLNLLRSRKNHLLNEKKITAQDLSKRFPNVIFSPESLAAIKEGADQRRQLLDELIVSFHPSNADLVADFRKALKTRNKILKNHLSGDVSRIETQRLLESLNPSFLRLAVELSKQRLQALRAIHEDFNKAMKSISRRENVDIFVDYVISGEHAFKFDSENIEKLLRKRLAELHDVELSSGMSLVGPQKHDVVFIYDGKDSRFYSSQGQQRALILSFKMAQIVYHRRIHGSYPVLMLDDVLSELDAEKRDSLIHFLSEISTQIFITTTDFELPSSMKSGDCAVLKIREGQIGS